MIKEQVFSEGDAFFAWTFERRRPLWQTVMSFFVPIVTVACCLFPVFPHWCKLLVLYFCLAFLGLIFGVLLGMHFDWISFSFKAYSTLSTFAFSRWPEAIRKAGFKILLSVQLAGPYSACFGYCWARECGSSRTSSLKKQLFQSFLFSSQTSTRTKNLLQSGLHD